jgi:uncharacterized protein YciI
MFLLLSRYLKPVDEIDRVLPAHREFLDRHYAAGHFMVSGPLEPRTGGVIVTFPMTRSLLESILAEDPFVLEGISEYQVLEFKPTKRTSILAERVRVP